MDKYIKELVFDALSNAMCSGYGDFVFDSPTEELANDLIMYECRLESTTPDVLIPYIELWKQEHTKKV
jgi:uncharacterized protein YihD (DUF1040 family)